MVVVEETSEGSDEYSSSSEEDRDSAEEIETVPRRPCGGQRPPFADALYDDI